jgi:glycosyltransferase involved in cell wall biosynthesis
MKIVFFVYRFPPKWLAGTEIATYYLAKYFQQYGHEVHVLTTLDKGLSKESDDQGFWVHRITYPKFGRVGIIIFWLKLLFSVKKIQPDIIHAQDIDMGIPALLGKIFLHKPYVVWAQGSDVYLSWLFRTPTSYLVMKNADRLIALTGDMKQEMQKICHRPVNTLPNGIELEKFASVFKENARDTLKFPLSSKIIIFVGTLIPVKGIKYLIRAMALLSENDSSIKLLLVGDGSERQELMTLTDELNLKDNIIFIGRVPNEKVPMYLAASDIFALPSKSEGFPLVVLEAMASGLPVVTTRVRGLPEIVKEGVNGYIVDPQNSEQLAAKLQMLINDSNLRQQISKNNKENVKLYSWRRITKDLEAIYLSVIHN